MRVLLASHRFPPDGITGVERATQALAAELARGGDTVSVVARRPSTTAPELRTTRGWLPDGTALHLLTGGGISIERFLLHHERIEQLFSAALLEAAPDVVHLMHLIDLSPRLLEIAHRHGVAVVLSLHDYYFACPRYTLRKRSGALCAGPAGGLECARSCFAHEGQGAAVRWGLRTLYFRRLLSLARRIICPSRYVAAFFERFGADPARIRVIPNGVSIEPTDRAAADQPTPRARGRLRLAFLGSVAAHKGPHIILEALRLAGLGPVELALLGPPDGSDPTYTRRLRQVAAAIPGLTFRMYGQYEPDELRLLLRDVDCVLLPSQWPENFPLVTQEALGRGIPLAASRLGGLPEIVRDGENGLTFDHDRPDQLAAILRRLAEDEGLLLRLREGARRSRVLSWAEHAAAVRDVYREALAERPGSGAPAGPELRELAGLHRALVELGFDRPEAVGLADGSYRIAAGG